MTIGVPARLHDLKETIQKQRLRVNQNLTIAVVTKGLQNVIDSAGIN